MKASKFTDAQKAFIIKQGEEVTAVTGICRMAGRCSEAYKPRLPWIMVPACDTGQP
jgi:hypothetical protein